MKRIPRIKLVTRALELPAWANHPTTQKPCPPPVHPALTFKKFLLHIMPLIEYIEYLMPMFAS